MTGDRDPVCYIAAVLDGATVQTWRATSQEAADRFAAALRAADLRRRIEIRPVQPIGGTP